jgi:hypothetical protein
MRRGERRVPGGTQQTSCQGAPLRGCVGISPWISVQAGKTALDKAREKGHGEVTSLLEAAARSG